MLNSHCPRAEMAQTTLQLDQETFSCAICLDLLSNPVTLPCGHSYCMDCIKTHWGEEDEEKLVGCPQCRQSFTPRPVLVKNTMLAALVEQLKKTELQAAPADLCYAGPEDVACDVCTGRKLKALKSCLRCLVSYCKKHLQRHYEVDQLKKHELVEPSKKLQENICSQHNEVMKMFCRTDQQCICMLCTTDDHKGHDTVSVAAERKERQRELELRRRHVQEKVQDREQALKLLQQVDGPSCSADEALENSKIFSEMMHLMEERQRDVEQQIRSQQQNELNRVKELEEQLEQEITELKRRDAELEQLSHTQDHTQFLLSFSSLRESAGWTNISVTGVDQSPPEPRTREEFLKYSCELTLDPNTAHRKLLLSEENRRATLTHQPQSYPDHPDRFTGLCQVLSRGSLTGRRYWEVKWRAEVVRVAVTYRTISRSGDLEVCRFGLNDKSWALRCYKNRYEFHHNNIITPVSGPRCTRIGVYLDHTAGVLSFYSVSGTMTLLHRVQTSFTQPLYAGLGTYRTGDTAEFCDLAQTFWG